MPHIDTIIKNLDKISTDKVRLEKIISLYNKCRTLRANSLVTHYLTKERKLNFDLSTLEFKELIGNFQLLNNAYSKTQTTSSSHLVVPIKNQYAELVSLDLVRLNEEGKKCTGDNDSKINLGSSSELATAAIVQQGNNYKKVYLAEGVETAASIAGLETIRGKYTVLAALGLDRFPRAIAYIKANFPVGTTIVILKDHDTDSELNKTFNKYIQEIDTNAYPIVVKQPNQENSDWNDVLDNNNPNALKEAYLSAEPYAYEKGNAYPNADTVEAEPIDIQIYNHIAHYKDLLEPTRLNHNKLALYKKLLDCLTTTSSMIKPIENRAQSVDLADVILLEKFQTVLQKLHLILKNDRLPEAYAFTELRDRVNELSKLKPSANMLKYQKDYERYQKSPISEDEVIQNPHALSSRHILSITLGKLSDDDKKTYSELPTAKDKYLYLLKEIDKECRKINNELYKLPETGRVCTQICSLSKELLTRAEPLTEQLNKEFKALTLNESQPSPADSYYLELMHTPTYNEQQKNRLQLLVNLVNSNYPGKKNTTFTPFASIEDLQPLTLIRSDSSQEDTVAELANALLKTLDPKDSPDFDCALEIASEIYRTFKVKIPGKMTDQEFDGIAFRQGKLTIIERKTNDGTGPWELQRNFLHSKIQSKIKFFELPTSERTYTITSPTAENVPNKNNVEPLIEAAKKLILKALSNKRIEFTLNTPEEQSIQFLEQITYPKSYDISLRLSRNGKGDEKNVLKQLSATQEALKSNLRLAGQDYRFLGNANSPFIEKNKVEDHQTVNGL